MIENLILGDFDQDILSERISKLKGGLLVIQPGGRTSVEVQECRDRIEDSLSTVRSAMEGGFLPGGGYALLHASNSLKDIEIPSNLDLIATRFGVKVTKFACEAPIK